MAADPSAGAPSHDSHDWPPIDWLQAHETGRRLEARIVQATQEGQWPKVHAVPSLLTHSLSGQALAVRRVTAHHGKRPPGVDGVTWNAPPTQGEAIHSLQRHGDHARPLRRVYLPTSNGTRRPLGIPTRQDRARHALDPLAESRADPHAYGCRQERSGAEALDQGCKALVQTQRAPGRRDGDITACFDTSSHAGVSTHIPMDQGLLPQGLPAGYLDTSLVHQTTDGPPQGGSISPGLAHRTWDGVGRRLREQSTPQSHGRKAGDNSRKKVTLGR